MIVDRGLLDMGTIGVTLILFVLAFVIAGIIANLAMVAANVFVIAGLA